MQEKKSNTGQLQDSKIPNCPVYKPKKISAEVFSKLKINEKIITDELNTFINFEKTIQHYFLKFLAGDKNTKSGFADVPVEELFLWKEVKIGKSVFVKNVSNAIKRFESALIEIDKQKNISVTVLNQVNQNLRPKDKRYGVRDCGMKVGNPDLNPDAFYAIPAEFIKEYLNDLIDYVNDKQSGDINKALFVNLQFIFIHPFIDGNGRLSRLLFLSEFKKNRTFAMLVLLYLKTINSFAYHYAMNDYRQGKVEKLKQLHIKAIAWTNQSIQVLSSFINEYINRVTQDKIDTDANYSQIVIKVDAKQNLDESIFRLHSKKAGKNIYINTALLNVLNQFDYYLRYQLRKHQ